MGRIIGIDYGLVRTGIAVTDNLQMIASPLVTLYTKQVIAFLINYCNKENIDIIVIGLPFGIDDEHDITIAIKKFFTKLKNVFPNKNVVLHNEIYTSKIAAYYVNYSHVKYTYNDKKNLDRISAAVILDSFLNSHHKKYDSTNSSIR